jgi:hypothetical protein
MASTFFEELFGTWPILEIPDGDSLPQCDDYVDNLLLLLEENDENCDNHTSNLDHSVSHVSLHLPHLEVKVNEDQEGTGSVLFSHMLAHINFCSVLKYFRNI